MRFDGYETGGYFDEMFEEGPCPRDGTRLLVEAIENMPEGELRRRQVAAERTLYDIGITFNVYGDDQGTERIFPFDLVPRVIEHSEWVQIESGLQQRIRAINLFIDDVYHDQKILADGTIPADIVRGASGFLEPCVGLNPRGGIWCHITGSDLVRDLDGRFYVLEDNLRVPSGVSYVLANRDLMKRTFPEVFSQSRVRPVSQYPTKLLQMLQHIAPPRDGMPTAAVLTPGIYNSAYFEHSFLAQQIGAQLVEGEDLVVENGVVYMRTTHGRQRCDVIYRRINDDYLDPKELDPESLLGVPGLLDAMRRGNVAVANAPGTGVADDKVIYSFVPRMIRYYLDEEPILPNVPTRLCCEPDGLRYTLDHLEDLVVKPANESGGYGMLVGPRSTKKEREEFATRLKAEPRNYISQPTLALSRSPVIVDDGFEGRHVDLRPFVIYGEDIFVLPGGLTRVALREGSLVVNSSQGGGSKDTWVVNAPREDQDNGHAQ